MNPVSKEFEKHGWMWDAFKQAYKYAALPSLTITHDEAKEIVTVDDVKGFTTRKVQEFTKELRSKRIRERKGGNTDE